MTYRKEEAGGPHKMRTVGFLFLPKKFRGIMQKVYRHSRDVVL